MKIYNTVLSVLVVYCYGVQGQNIRAQAGFERQGGLLSGFGSLGGGLGVSSISSGLETIAGGVRNILSSTRDTVDKLTKPIRTDFNAQFGLSTGSGNKGSEYVPSNPDNVGVDQSDGYDDNGPQYGPGNSNSNNAQIGGITQNEGRPDYNSEDLNKGNSPGRVDNYPHYETPNQNNDESFNGAQTNNFNKNGQQNQQSNDGIIYTDDNFPIILLKENEIRR